MRHMWPPSRIGANRTTVNQSTGRYRRSGIGVVLLAVTNSQLGRPDRSPRDLGSASRVWHWASRGGSLDRRWVGRRSSKRTLGAATAQRLIGLSGVLSEPASRFSLALPTMWHGPSVKKVWLLNPALHPSRRSRAWMSRNNGEGAAGERQCVGQSRPHAFLPSTQRRSSEHFRRLPESLLRPGRLLAVRLSGPHPD